MEGRIFLEKKINVSHLVYIIIIFTIVLSFFLVIAFGGLKNANSIMGTASTVSSLILSVVAIVLSLIDVAGQRQSIVDLKETAEKLNDSNDKSIKQISFLQEKLMEVSDLKEALLEQVNKNLEWKEDITEILIHSTKKVNDKIEQPEDLKNVINEINRKINLVTQPLKYEKNLKNLDKYRILIHTSQDGKASQINDISNVIKEIINTFNLNKDVDVEIRNGILRLTFDCSNDFSLDTGSLLSILNKYNMSWISDGFTLG
jgi:hypothetical protein